MRKLSTQEALRVGQEVGTMAYLVHDAVCGAGAEMLSFNAAQLRMIAASRKKTDWRDAYWIARALQTGLHPQPVYIPTGEAREVGAMLTRRRMIQRDRNRWQYRARAALRGSGHKVRTGGHSLRKALDPLLSTTLGADLQRLGSITKTGSKALRSTLVQAAHVTASRCRSPEAEPLQAIGERVRGSRGRRKIAIVALARHLLRIAYYVLRDGTVYEAKRLQQSAATEPHAA